MERTRAKDTERIARIRHALTEAGLDALIGTLPAHVLLLTGYWPVVGTSMAVVNTDGMVGLLAPQDEHDLARQSWADKLDTFEPASLEHMRNAEEAIRPHLADMLRSLGIANGQIGYEAGSAYEPASYASMHLYGGSVRVVLSKACSGTSVPADPLFARLGAVKTPREIDRIRVACTIAGHAFDQGVAQLRPGLRETEAAANLQEALSVFGVGHAGVERSGGFAFCMSGPNSALASGAYAQSRARELQTGDLVLVHCNSYADGFWTDITRTYCLGGADRRQMELIAAIFAARSAALQTIRPGVRASEVDRAARDVLASRGFGKEFKHPTGHGVGFRAINHNALPCIHPKSDQLLEAGMVFNVEPAIYIEGYGGLRHCDVVTVTGEGVEVLTAFQDAPAHVSLPAQA